MKEVILDVIRHRLDTEIDPRNSLAYLTKVPPEVYYETLINTVYVFTRPRKSGKSALLMFSEVVCGIGHRIRALLNLKKDTAIAARTGAFLLWTFEDMGMLQVQLTKGKRGHNQYAISLLDDEPLTILWRNLPDSAIDRLPSREPWAEWTSTRHVTGARLIKTNNKDVLAGMTPQACPLVYDMINNAQKVPWTINTEMLPIYDWCLKHKAAAFMDIWEAQNKDARTTKLREVKTIADMARRLESAPFYHLYYLDFRGRKYPATAYLHEQGSDFARSLLYRYKRKAITEKGFMWLQIVLATNWGGDAGRLDKLKTDKIPIVDRVAWAETNELAMLGYAQEPTYNVGWMEADAPWQFLAGCQELLRLRRWQAQRGDMHDYSYLTGYEAYIDGSNNGCQHLAALTKDEIVAPHVNLVPLQLPGDLYRYVAGHAWSNLAERVKDYTKEDISECRVTIRAVRDMKQNLERLTDKDARMLAHIEHKDYRLEHTEQLAKAGPVYWLRFTDAKDRRKLVKRNVMTLPYGGTPYGLGQQQIEDAPKHGIPALRYLERSWGAMLGRIVYDDCRVSLARPMRLLGVFEAAGKMAEARDEFLSWTVPVTNFPVVQNYTEGVVKKVWVQYGPPIGAKKSTGYYVNTLQLSVTFPEIQIHSKGKQGTGASPNCIHSFDAAHLTLTVAACDFPVTTIHDSFGCLLPDMPVLYQQVRKQFVRFYEHEPLESVLRDFNSDISNVAFGNLDINLILDSEYAFI